MQYFLSTNFEKQLKKFPKKVKNKVMEKLLIFMTDPMHYTLSSHPLTGEWAGHRSINITGDIRAIYKKLDEKVVRFVTINSHSELYK